MKLYDTILPDEWFITELKRYNPNLRVRNVLDTAAKARYWEVLIRVPGSGREGRVMDWKHPYLSLALISRLSKMDVHRRYKSLRAYIVQMEYEREKNLNAQKIKGREQRVEMLKEFGKRQLLNAMEEISTNTRRK